MENSPRTEWEPLVGSLVLSCGDIELRLLQLYWNLTLHGQYDEGVRCMGMGEKAKFIRGAVNSASLDTNLEKQIKLGLEKVIKLAHSRNLVAHNPLYMDIFSDEYGNFALAPSIRSLRDNKKHISFEGLKSLNEDAKDISRDLYEMVLAVAEAACPVA